MRFAVIAFFLYLAAIAIWLDFAYVDGSQWVLTKNAAGGLLASGLIMVAPELAGIVIGIFTIDYLNAYRQDQQLKKQLILQLGSKHNDVTDTAIAILKVNGWLYDDSIVGAYLEKANLQGARLSKAGLSWAILNNANLSNADLGHARLVWTQLKNVNLSNADLSGASLGAANLSYGNLKNTIFLDASLAQANLSNANLEEAILTNANLFLSNLSDANLIGANLDHANLRSAIFTKNTKWPEDFDPIAAGAKLVLTFENSVTKEQEL